MHIAFINRPNGDLTFSGGLTGNAAADFLLGLPAQARATTQQATQDGYGWLFAGYVQDDFRVTPQLTVNLGAALRTADAVHRQERRDHRVPHRRSSPPSSRTRRRGLVYPGDTGVPRGDRADRQEQLRAAARRWRGIRSATADQRALGVRRVLRRAGRAGRLLPERRAVAAVHAAGRAEHADADHAGRSAGRRGRAAESVSRRR